jgi:hypothetical protein
MFQVLLDNLMENMRSEMAEIVETERHILQQTLERESGSIRCQLKEACTNNRCEMISMVKAEVQKCLKNSQEKMLAMTHSIKQEVKDLKTELGVAEVHNNNKTPCQTLWIFSCASSHKTMT